MTGNKVNKATQIDKFINDVITPAKAAIAKDAKEIQAASSAFPNGAMDREEFDITHNSFSQVNSAGGMISPSELVGLFQYYAYNLTSIRKATITMFTTVGAVETNPTVVDNEVCSLSPDYRMSLADFNNKVTVAPNPLTALGPGQPASETAINALISRLAQILADHRNLAPAVAIAVCHSSTGMTTTIFKHKSRGRR